MNRKLLFSTLIISVLFLCGCKKEKQEPQVLNSPSVSVTTDKNKAVISWKAVEHAASFEWRLEYKSRELESGKTENASDDSKTFENLENGEYVFHIRSVSGDSRYYKDSDESEYGFTIKYEAPDPDPDPDPEKPTDTDAFSIEIISASTDGVEYKYIPKDKEMYYSDFWGDPSFFTDYTDEDIIEEIVSNANEMLKESDYDIEYLLENTFIFKGDVTDKGHARELGFIWQVGVTGLEYDAVKKEFSRKTNLYKTEPFAINTEPEPAEGPWADMKNPEYKEHKGKDKLVVEIIPNEEAKGYVYGKAYPENYLDTHSETEVINELLDLSNMSETWIADWDMYLRAEAAPGERLLFAVATMYQSGKKGEKLNWMVLEAPSAPGGKVRIIKSATGEVTPPDDKELTFNASVTKIEGSKVWFSVDPSDDSQYYHVGYVSKSELESSGDDKVLEALLQRNINRLILIYDYSFTSLCDLDIVRQGDSGGEYDYLDENLENGEYFLCVFGVKQDGERVASTTGLTKVPFTITEGASGPEVTCTYKIEDGKAYGYDGHPMVILDFKMSEECFSFKYADMFAPGTFSSMSKEDILAYFENTDNAYSEETGTGWTEESQDKSQALLYTPEALGTSMEVIMVGYDLMGQPGNPKVLTIDFPARLD